MRIDYLQPSGETLTKMYAVGANGRHTVWVDDEQFPAGSGNRALANAAVSATVTSTNGVPIIVERTMWWPQPIWHEAHNSPGATATGTQWALAGGEVGGPGSAETYILIANTSAFEGRARVTLLFDDGSTASRVFVLPPRSRTNVPAGLPEAQGGFREVALDRRFGVLIDSLGEPAAELVVERAMYGSPGGIAWSSGTNVVATRLR